MLSIKHAASRPRPPLPSAWSGSIARRVFDIDAEIRQCLARGLGDAEIAERIEQKPPEQEFDREVIDALLLLGIGLPRGMHPAVDHAVAHGERAVP